MASQASLDDAQHAQQQQQEGASFTHQQWQPADTSLLQPTQLPLSRVPRAWERKPLAPFAKKNMRAAKVWKRAAAPVEIRKRPSLGAGNGKPVKKIRLEGGVGVARWEGEGEEGVEVGSPARKIVLRRDRVGEEGLLALPVDEEEEAAEDDGAVVEVFDEEGTLLDAGAEDVGEGQDWEDEELFEPTMMHLGEMVEEAQDQADAGTRNHVQRQLDDTSAAAADIEPSFQREEEQDEAGALPEQPTTSQSEEQLPTLPPPQEVILPEGFVSPVKQRNVVPERRGVRKSTGPRRRTLPTLWKPSRLRQVVNASEDDDAEAVVDPTIDSVQAVLEQPAASPNEAQEETRSNDTPDQEWEDVEDEPQMELNATMDNASADEQDARVQDLQADSNISQLSDGEGEEPDAQRSPARDAADLVQPVSPTKLPSSPVPSIEGQHPRLPLRRSPRRKSSSPVKQGAIRSFTGQSHLVAFTPMKGLQPLSALGASPHNEQSAEDNEDDDESAPPLLERSVSAPPEEPQMSPHRLSRPRVSDDTALLQAFLNRAAETKSSGRRISASKRESMTNRRDSDAVRQALASPAKPEVLADLDPNSPSPRKPAAPSDEIDDANILPEPEPSPLQKTRRSGRATRKAAPQTATPAAAPNKISIRGSSKSVDLKKSEAQELSQITRTNTRKNKGGAILPLYRLSKMQQQGVVDPLDDGTADAEPNEPKPNSKGRALRWNETLVEFWQGGDVSETSILSDELSASMPAPAAVEKMEVDSESTVPAPPPPAETPSKPKIRRLKAPRTAATPGKAASAPAPAEDTEKKDADAKAAQSAPQPKAPTTSKRRSRIATPAKGLSNSSLLPADLEPTPAPVQATVPAPPQPQKERKKSLPAPSKRKAPASKLPAPASLSSSQSGSQTSALGQGKENIIASPPKKKPSSSAASLPSSKTFAPKLDFSKSLAPAGASQDEVPGLASPAKKVGRRGVTFAPPSLASAGSSGGGSQEDGKEEVPLGLRSPAKKRTRRGVIGAG